VYSASAIGARKHSIIELHQPAADPIAGIGGRHEEPSKSQRGLLIIPLICMDRNEVGSANSLGEALLSIGSSSLGDCFNVTH